MRVQLLVGLRGTAVRFDRRVGLGGEVEHALDGGGVRLRARVMHGADEFVVEDAVRDLVALLGGLCGGPRRRPALAGWPGSR